MEHKPPSEFMVAFGARILARRKQLGLTQEQTAQKAQLSSQFLSFVESGKKSVRAENIVNLAKALEVSTDYLLTGVCSDSDVSRVYELLRSFDSQELVSAEGFLRKLKQLCQGVSENPTD